ncbi:SH3 domain-containing protein [Streptomyces sp. NEAU-S7GS2]|uniref:SH3 domain-containing protein n=1 Tax=Streptomyces sp. NEAU-S7GS2 TaxID=2202000 RepID=UPI000D6F5830|nr:SH3 domain-containing protein [Streptomyces sp. NEAU-S7GS2]AWN24852.1 hypothetical protein DKG71_00475 [Streptomyces sp. NEAU-S7GS2]
MHLRSGPGTNYTSKGTLKNSKPTSFMLLTCGAKSDRWLYGKVTDGPNKGKSGWVSRPYMYVIL